MTAPVTVTDKQWAKWGETDPYRGVLGIDTSEMGDAAQKREFFATGERDVEIVLSAIEARAPGFVAKGGTVLDFGCGVGRLMQSFGKRGFEVSGIDISPAIIEVAKKNLAESGLSGKFYSSVDAINEQFDLVHSFIVIQHIRPVQGMGIVDSLMQRVRPGGFLAIQFTLGSLDWKRTAVNWLRYRIPLVQYAANVLRRRPVTEPVMELNTYDLHAVPKLCQQAGIEVMSVFPHGGDFYRGVMIVGQKTVKA